MPKLKLCPMNRMSECVREKCEFWIETAEMETHTGQHHYREYVKVGSCAVKGIATFLVMDTYKEGFQSRARMDFAEKNRKPIKMEMKKAPWYKRIFRRTSAEGQG